jgi:hypothetical protein
MSISGKRVETDCPVTAEANGRRRGDAILLAFNYACDHDDLEVAAQLLIIYESVVTRSPLTMNEYRRGEFDSLISAHGRLWTLLRSGTDNSEARHRRTEITGSSPKPSANDDHAAL